MATAIPWPPVQPGPDDSGPLAGEVRVYIALPNPADVWDVARWDQGRWDAQLSNPTILDVTPDCDGVDVTYGRSDTTSHQEPMSCRFSLNNRNGDYTPWQDSPARRRRWFLGAPVRVASSTGPLFTGYVSNMAELDATLDDEERLVAFACTGPAGLLAAANGTEQPSQGANETAGPRIARIIAAAYLPAWIPSALDAGTVPMQATTLAGGALEEIWLTADSDGGAFLEDHDGTLVYLTAGTLDNQPRYTTPQAIFVDDTPTDPTLTVECMTSFTATLSTDHVISTVSIAAAGGTEHIAANPADQWAGERTYGRHDLIYADESYGAYLATMTLDRLGHAELFLDPISFDPLLSSVNWQTAHTIRPYDKIRLIRTRDAERLDIAASVDQVHHTITNLGWTVDVTSSPGDQRFSYARWDVSQWNVDRWT